MPKTPSEKLFRLVKSLSGSEKRYFKIFINNKGGKDNKYFKLFDAIEEQELFNEEELQQIVYPREQVESRKYSEMKGYLYDLILKSLQAYDEKTSVDYKLKGMLLSVRTLYKRSLFEDCKELLHKAKKIATKYEDFNSGLELLRWEKQIAYAETDITYLDKELERIEVEEKKLVEHIQNISEYRNMFFKVLISVRKDAASGERNSEKLSFIKEDSLMNDIENAESYKAKMLYYRVLSLYYLAIRNPRKFYSSSAKLLEQIESKQYMIQEDASEYISALSNHIMASGTVKEFIEVEEILGKLKNVSGKTHDDNLKIYRQYYSGRLRLYANTGDFKNGYKELQEHMKTRKKFDLNFFRKDSFYIVYFTISFGVEKYEEALSYLNEWLGMSRNIERKDLQSLARILNLIIHYEIKNTDLIESLLRSTYRFLSDKDFFSDFEKKFLSSLREAIEIQSRKELKKHWNNLSQEYERLEEKSGLPSIIRWFPVKEWIDAQANEASFAQIVKDQFESRLPKNSNP
ncbi:MAG: hypothetical protein ACI85O_000162 [Saprospiraceae bacterium]|jgi:hypothetical protein